MLCQHFIIHARKAWLQGLSPKENRTIPPLNYPWVYQLKKDFPQLKITINGGIENCNEVKNHLDYVDGVMLGRSVYHNPFLLREIDVSIFGNNKNSFSREQILKKYMNYIKQQIKIGVPIRSMTRHILGLYHGESNAKLFRRYFPSATILRPSIIFSVDDSLTTKFMTLLNRLPFFPLFGNPNFMPIHVSDVTNIIYHVISKNIYSKIECIGPETISLKEILEHFIKAY